MYFKLNITVAPNESALIIQRWTDSVETIAFIRFALIAILFVNVHRTLTRMTGTNFGQVALISRLTTQVTLLSQLQ